MGASFSGTLSDAASLSGVFQMVTEHQEAMIHQLWYETDETVAPLAASIMATSESDPDGRGFITRVEYATGSSASPNFSVAQYKANGTSTGSAALRNRWISQSTLCEAVASWDRTSLLQSFAKGPDEVFDVVEYERRSKIELLRQRVSIMAVEDGSGRVTSVLPGSWAAFSVASVGGTSWNNFYATPSTINRLRIGDDLTFYPASTTAGGTPSIAQRGSATGGGSYGVWTVIGLDPDAGIVTVMPATATQPYTAGATDLFYGTSPGTGDGISDGSGSGGTPGRTGVGDDVVWNGYRVSNGAWITNGSQAMTSGTKSATYYPICMLGMKAWVPFTATTGGVAFQNIIRDGIPELMGLRYNATGTGLDHAGIFINAAQKAHQYGTHFDAIYTSVQDYGILVRDKEAVKTIEIKVGEYNIGFEGVQLMGGPKGSVKVVPDATIEQGYAYGGPWNDKRFRPMIKHDMELINTDNFDGLEFLRLSASTAYEQRMFNRGAFILPAPGKFMAIQGFLTS